ncbi:MAG: Crp/Fnr family transcriptional regulator [Pyrinomonadaceae bacterium]
MHDANLSLSLDNRLLRALPDDELRLLRPHLEFASYRPGVILAEPGDKVRRCYFPGKGMISLLSVTEQGNTVEVGYTGREGMVGLAALLGKNEILYQQLVQSETDCLVADAAVVQDLFDRGGEFHDLLLRYMYALLKQISQTCVCNHFHTIEARLCRWLTVMCERSSSGRLAVTQEFLAHMLGVQRTSIGLIANAMQRAGIIRYSRGIVEIIDFDRLKASACECYSIVNAEYENLFKKKRR